MIKTLKDFNFKDKNVLVRCDLNSSVSKWKVQMSERIVQSCETIKFILKQKGKVIILAHQGRKGDEEYTSLKQHAKLLSKVLTKKVNFVDDVYGIEAMKAIGDNKGVLVLENVRSLDEETQEGDHTEDAMIKRLSFVCDIYVNDAFSVCHRKHASIVGFRKMDRCAGLLLERELKAIDMLASKIKKPCIYVLAGSKAEDNIPLMKYVLENDKVDKILCAGRFAQYCWMCLGVNFGFMSDYIHKKGYKEDKEFGLYLKKNSSKIILPMDYALDVKGSRKEIEINNFPSKFMINDIGAKTIKQYVDILKKAKTVFVKGTLGYAEEKKFAVGTLSVYKQILKIKGFSLVGGGDTTTALRKYGVNDKKFGYVSLSGGALLMALRNEKLPGVEALKC